MLRWPRRTTFFMLVAIALLSVALRYPLVDHERYQADSYYIHLLSASIVDSHRAVWTLEITSFFGYYPVSYPTGVPMVVAELSDLTGMNVETCILVLGIFVGIALSFGSFIVARRFLNSSALCLLCVFIVTVSPRIIDSSYWVGSARTPLVLMIMLLFILVTGLFGWTPRRVTLLGLIVITAFACLAVHHMAILILIFAVTYLMAEFFVMALGRKGRRKFLVRVAAYGGILVAAFVLSMTGFINISQGPLEASVGEGGFFPTNFLGLNTLSKLASSYVQQMSIGLIAGALGIVYLLRKIHISPKTMFIPLIIPAFIPIVGNSLYLSMLLMPFVAVVIALGYAWMFKLKPFPKFWKGLVCVLLLASLLFPGFMVSHWNNEKYATGDRVVAAPEAHSAGLYEKYSLGDVPFLWNNEVLAAQVSAFSEGTAIRSGVPAVIAGLVDPKVVKEGTTTNEWPQVMYQRFIWPREGVIGDQLILMMSGDGVERQVPQFINAAEGRTSFLCMIDRNTPGSFSNTYSQLPSELATRIGNGVGPHVDSYIIYSDQRVSWYAVRLWP